MREKRGNLCPRGLQGFVTYHYAKWPRFPLARRIIGLEGSGTHRDLHTHVYAYTDTNLRTHTGAHASNDDKMQGNEGET